MSQADVERLAGKPPVRVVATRNGARIDVELEGLGPSREATRPSGVGRHPVDLDLWLEREADYQIAKGPGWRVNATHDQVEHGRRKRPPFAGTRRAPAPTVEHDLDPETAEYLGL